MTKANLTVLRILLIIGEEDNISHFSLTKPLRDKEDKHYDPSLESDKERGC